MKNLCYALFFAFLGSNTAFAQDLITTRTGEDIKAQVTEIGLTDVKYRPWDSLEGVTATVPKSDILLIRYEDGGKEIFEQAEPAVLSAGKTAGSGGVVSALNSGNMFMQGQIDAKRYYKGYKDPVACALVGTLVLGPVLGLIPTLAITSTVPQAVNLNYPSESLMRNPQYAQGYVREAKHIKSQKSWVGYAIGAVVSTVISAILISVALSNWTF